MPIGPARMPLFDHLGELRMRLVRIVVCLFLACCVFYLASPTIINLLMAPVIEYLPTNADGTVGLNVLGALDGFTIRFGVALWASLVACMPIIIWQVLAFFLPALKPKERRWFIPTFAIGCALFIFGTLFCYFVILDPAVQFLTSQTAEFANVFPEAKTWIDTIIKFELGFGFAFELPLIVFYLCVFEIVPYSKLRQSWRTVYVALLVISAMVTPDASPVTMGLMVAVLIALYEISLLFARIVLGKRVQEQKAELEREAAEDAAWQEEWAEIKRKRAEEDK